MLNCRMLGFAFLAAFCLTGCGSGTDKGDAGGGKPAAGSPHSQEMLAACELSLKILTERESGKSVDEVNQKYAQHVADIDARIAKLPKLSDDEDLKLMQANASKLREVEMKFSALAEKGTLNETGKLLKLPNYALGELTALEK